ERERADDLRHSYGTHQSPELPSEGAKPRSGHLLSALLVAPQEVEGISINNLDQEPVAHCGGADPRRSRPGLFRPAQKNPRQAGQISAPPPAAGAILPTMRKPRSGPHQSTPATGSAASGSPRTTHASRSRPG